MMQKENNNNKETKALRCALFCSRGKEESTGQWLISSASKEDPRPEQLEPTTQLFRACGEAGLQPGALGPRSSTRAENPAKITSERSTLNRTLKQKFTDDLKRRALPRQAHRGWTAQGLGGMSVSITVRTCGSEAT